MTVELPDIEALKRFTPEELRLELACALYAREKISKPTGAALAGVDFFAFQRALGQRGISSVTDETLQNGIRTIKALFPKPKTAD